MKIKRNYIIFPALILVAFFIFRDYNYHLIVSNHEQSIKRLLETASLSDSDTSSNFNTYHDPLISKAIKSIDTAKVQLIAYYSFNKNVSYNAELGRYCLLVNGACGVEVPYFLMEISDKYPDHSSFLSIIGINGGMNENQFNSFELAISEMSMPELILTLNTIQNKLIALDKKTRGNVQL